MGKSSKKSSTEMVVAAPASVPPSKSAKEGYKRIADVVLVENSKTKKQKLDQMIAAMKKKKKQETSSSEDLTESSSGEEPVITSKKQPAKNGSVGDLSNKKGRPASSSSDSSDCDSDEETKPKAMVPFMKLSAGAARNGSVAVSKKEDSASDSGSSSSDEDDNKPAKVASQAKNVSAVPPKKKTQASDSSFESDSEEDEKITTMVTSQAKQFPVPNPNKMPAEASTKNVDSCDSSSESGSEEDEVKQDTDVEMADASSPKTNDKQAGTKSEKKVTTGSKTLFVGNLSYSVERADVEEFFKDAGEVIDIRFSTERDGRFKGFGHVEFATEDAAQKALELNNQDLLGRPVRLEIAHERGSNTPHNSKETNSYQKGGKRHGQTIFVRGFDKSLGVDQVHSSLEEHFRSCGEISRMSILKDYETGSVKGFAYIDFKDSESFSKALELNGSELGDFSLMVEEANPRSDNRDGGGRSGGRSGKRDGDSRFGGRRGGGGRGRGNFNKSR